MSLIGSKKVVIFVFFFHCFIFFGNETEIVLTIPQHTNMDNNKSCNGDLSFKNKGLGWVG